MEIFLDIIQGNSLNAWLRSLIVGVGVGSVLLFLRMLFRKIVKPTREETMFKKIIRAIFQRTNSVFICIASVYAGTQLLEIPEMVITFIQKIFYYSIFFQLGIWASVMIEISVQGKYSEKKQDDPAYATTIKTFGTILKLIAWILLFFLALQNINNVNLTALITSLGIGGVAVGLAVQSILGDIFSSISITLDKPFVIGDFVKIGDVKGNIEHIGLQSTKIRSITGEKISIANSDILNSRISNYANLDKRYHIMNIGVHPETPLEKLEEIPDWISSIIDNTKFGRTDHVRIVELGAYTIDIKIAFFIESGTYIDYIDTKQAIITNILRLFEQESIIMPFPTQNILLEK